MACSEHRAFRAHMEPTFVLTWNPCAHGTHGCTQCAQCAQKNANCVKSVQIVTILKLKTFLCTLFTKKSFHVTSNCPLLPATADHPGSQRAPQSGFSFLDSDTTRWQKWIISRACLSGDDVPGISRFSCSHGTHVSSCAHMEPVRTWNPLVCKVCTVCTDGEQCAQCAQKNANCVKSVQLVTILCTLFTKYFRHVSAASGSLRLRCPGNRPAALTRPMGRWGGCWFG